jgi:GNAT superfamily N-acetyltransferase
MEKLWLLNDLYVKPDNRQQGISVALINEAKQHCKKTNACGLLLETAKTNIIGNTLYIKTQFVLDTEHNYYFWESA